MAGVSPFSSELASGARASAYCFRARQPISCSRPLPRQSHSQRCDLLCLCLVLCTTPRHVHSAGRRFKSSLYTTPLPLLYHQSFVSACRQLNRYVRSQLIRKASNASQPRPFCSAALLRVAAQHFPAHLPTAITTIAVRSPRGDNGLHTLPSISLRPPTTQTSNC